MKKFAFMMLALMATAAMGTITLTSCNNDEEQEIPEPEPVVANYARYIVNVSEDIFALCDGVVTLEHDGKTETYKLDGNTKVDDTKLGSLMGIDGKVAGRKLDLAGIEYGAHPFKATLSFQINEEGKKQIAENPDKEIDLGVTIDLGESNAKGEFTYGVGKHLEKASKGIALKNLATQLAINEEHNAFEAVLK